MNLSVVVPVYNMSCHLQNLWDSARASGLLGECREFLFVDDGSTDGTFEMAKSLEGSASEVLKKTVIRLNINQGRFKARKEGAEKAAGDLLLFLDARVGLPLDFSEVLKKRITESLNILPTVSIDPNSSIYSLYWKRSHEWLYRSHYRLSKVPITLSRESFDRHLVGTTAFLVERDLFIEACDHFYNHEPLNDDLPLLREIVNRRSILMFPDLMVNWKPRETLNPFLQRIWARGPSFAEYHLFTHRRRFFKVCVGLMVSFVFFCFLLSISPVAALILAGIMLLLAQLPVILMSMKVSEFFKMVFLHHLVCLVFSFAVVRGVQLQVCRRIK